MTKDERDQKLRDLMDQFNHINGDESSEEVQRHLNSWNQFWFEDEKGTLDD
jgi:hypothetical protein